jgi:hypothetical protein
MKAVAPPPPEPSVEEERRPHDEHILDSSVALAGGWTAWPWIWLRGAGFPADLTLPLATEKAAAAAAACAEAADAQEARRADALEACERELITARGALAGRLARLTRRLRASGAPGQSTDTAEEWPADVQAALAALVASTRALTQLRADVDSSLPEEMAAARSALQDLVREGRMREALVWQNRRLVHGSADAFLRRSVHDTDGKMREYDRLFATYVQRYCVKNDTIGFFGPVGWARWSESNTGLRCKSDLDRLATRTVYFEHWAIDALATHLAAAPALRAHLAPRRMPSIRLVANTMLHGIDGRAELPAWVASLLAACDGEKSARDLADDLAAEHAEELAGPEDVLDVLADLAAQGVITWTLELPTGDPHPERTLRRLLEGISDPDARRPAVAALDRLEAARDQVAASAGQPAALDEALDQLESEFGELTGMAANRHHGRTYAGRTLIFEDCRRAGEAELGADLRTELGITLEPILLSARWYTYEIGRRYRDVLDSVHRDLAAESGEPRVPMLAFRQRADPHFAWSQLEPPPIVRDVAGGLHRRWREILGLRETDRHVERTSAELAASAREAFRAPHPGWPNARYHSPDILIAASSPTAAEASNVGFVLGELHIGLNTLLTHVAIQQHPRPLDLVRTRERDRPEPGIAPVESKAHASRADNSSVARHDVHLEIGATRSWRSRDQVVAIADLVVERVDGRLTATTIDRRHRFDILSFFDQDLTFAAAGGFGLISGGTHTPRITIDRMVVVREGWRFAREELPFASAPTPADRLIGAQRWRAAHGLPRFLFARVQSEPKPLYIDLASSIYVDILAKLVRGAPTLRVTEMLPTHDQNWLSDDAGRRYASELRFAVLDPESWRPA